jgi:hypothetical protein
MRFQTCTDIALALSDSATIQMSAAGQPLDSSATVLESPVWSQTDIAGTVVETPSYAPRPQTAPPVTTGPGTGPASIPGTAYTAEPEKKKGGIPTWGWVAGCLVFLCIGGVVALGGFGVLGSILGNATPTTAAVAAATATSDTLDVPTATAETADPVATATPESVGPTATADFNLLPDDTATPPVRPVGGGPIGLGGALNGSIANGQTQEWSFSASAGDRIDVQVAPLTEDFDLIINIFNEARQSIVPGGEVDLSFATEEITNLVIPVNGDYIIVVKGFDSSAAGEYIVSLNTAAPSPPGSTLQASDTLSAGSEHLFPFNSTIANAAIVAIVNPEDDLDVVVGIYDDDTDTLLEEVDNSFDRETLSFNLPSTGNFYIKVIGFDGSTGSYDITLSGPPEVTFLLANQDQVQGSFGSSSELDYYFRGESGDIFTASVLTSDSIDLVIELFEDGITTTSLVEIDNNLSGEGEELTFTLPADGLYIIRIREFFGEPGTFVLTIS